MKQPKIKNKKILLILEEAIELIKITKSVKKIVLFGSQARGDYQERSDIDLAVFGKISISDCATLKERLNTIRTLRKIDLVIYDDVDEDMQNSINQETIILYERN